jgi:N-acetylneuraminate synthase
MTLHVIAEIGINHDGSFEIAKQLIAAAKEAGADSVKLQKRLPKVSVPKAMWDIQKETPWGDVESYLAYKEHMELSPRQCGDLWRYAKSIGIPLFWSVWDLPSVDEVLCFEAPYIKIPSAKATDKILLRYVKEQHGNTRIIVSTGMCTMEEVEEIVAYLYDENPIIMACTSTYPSPKEELNLRTVRTYKAMWPDLDIGWSGHEVGLATTVATVAMGATFIERHITLDRSRKGTDHAASVEPNGFRRLIDDARAVDAAMGDGVKRVMPGERAPMLKLRGT